MLKLCLLQPRVTQDIANPITSDFTTTDITSPIVNCLRFLQYSNVHVDELLEHDFTEISNQGEIVTNLLEDSNTRRL